MDEKLLRFRKDIKYATVDCETFNLALTFHENRPWQVGILMAEGEKTISSHDIRIKTKWQDAPHLSIGAGAAAITHFNQKEHDKVALDQDIAFKKTWQLLESVDYLIFHNGIQFDQYLLRGWAILNNSEWKWIVPKIIDTKAIAFAIKTGNHFNPKKQEFFEWQFQMAVSYQKSIKTNLKLMCQEYNIEFNENKAHEAGYDILKTFELWNKMKWQVEL